MLQQRDRDAAGRAESRARLTRRERLRQPATARRIARSGAVGSRTISAPIRNSRPARCAAASSRAPRCHGGEVGALRGGERMRPRVVARRSGRRPRPARASCRRRPRPGRRAPADRRPRARPAAAPGRAGRAARTSAAGRHRRVERMRLRPRAHRRRGRARPLLPPDVVDQPAVRGPARRRQRSPAAAGDRGDTKPRRRTYVAASGGAGAQLRSAPRGGTAAAQRRRVGVQHEHAGGDRMPARVAQHGAIADLHRQVDGHRQPRGAPGRAARTRTGTAAVPTCSTSCSGSWPLACRAATSTSLRPVPRAGRDQHVAATDVGLRDAAQVERDPRRRDDPVTRLAHALDAAHADRPPAQFELVTDRDRARRPACR